MRDVNLIWFYLQMHMISHSSVCEDAAQRKCMNECFCLKQNMQSRGARELELGTAAKHTQL